MYRVNGIGGFFFRALDPVALGQWYNENLGVTVVPSNYDEPGWRQETGPTAFASFPETTTYFGDAGKIWMINFRVRNLDAMTAQLRAGASPLRSTRNATRTAGSPISNDPEGNPIELWEAEGRDAPRQSESLTRP